MIKGFCVPFRLDGLNDYTRANRAGAQVGAAMKRKNEAFVMDAIRDAHLNDLQIEVPVKICFHWFENNRKRDLDNIAFAKKFILDALVRSGTIKNDNWECVIGFTDEFTCARHLEPHVNVIIITIDDAVMEHVI